MWETEGNADTVIRMKVYEMKDIYIEELQVIRMGLLGLILITQCVFDIKSKRLPLWITGAGVGVGMILWMIEGSCDFMRFTSIIPGILCLVIAKVSREAIGYGDGLLLCMMGFYLECLTLIGICLWAFTLAGILGLFLLVTKRKKGKQEIPFVPFLFLGFLLEVILC